jgi:hypothetical protein
MMVAVTDDLAARLGAHRDDSFCYLTTRGRVTGRPHEIEIWFALDGTTLYLLAGGRDRSDWARNLLVDAGVTLRLGSSRYSGAARVVAADTEEDERARTLVYDKYACSYGGDLVRWRARALPVAVDVTAIA